MLLEQIAQATDGTAASLDLVTKGGALVLLALLLGYLARAIPKHVGRLQDSFDATIRSVCDEHRKDRETAEATSKAEREACERRVSEERTANERRFVASQEFHANVCKILSDQNANLARLVERLPGK